MKRRKNRIILEFSEFNLQRYNQDNAQVSLGVTSDPSMSVNAFDRHNDAIRFGMSRINGIMKSLSNSFAFRGLKAKLSFEEQLPEKLKILRILPNNTDFNVYISFEINEKEYNGVIKNLLGNTDVNSDVFDDNDLIQSKEWVIRLKGLFVETIKKWLLIEPGEYKFINDKMNCFNLKTGVLLTLNKNNIITVIKTIPKENKIVFKYKNDEYFMNKNNFIYFNYWFEKI